MSSVAFDSVTLENFYIFLFQLFQDDLEAQQQKVNSLTHMVVVVDDNANDNATAELEEQLGILGERWSGVCKWTEERYTIISSSYVLNTFRRKYAI
jgi:hypothetical protein